jgi:hypothetical protein
MLFLFIQKNRLEREGTRLVAVRPMFSLSATRELYNLSLARRQ